jgi:hypothetical protein
MMTMMKKITLLMIIAGALYVTSCKNITDITPTDALGSAAIFSDSTNIELAIVGMYNSVQSQIFGYNGGGDARGYPFGAAHVEQAEMHGGEDLVNTQGFFTIVYVNNQTNSSPNCVNLWAGLFEVVNVANTNIAGLTTTTAISKSRANGFIAECRFLRAMAVHDLLIFFARPYADNPTTNLGVPYRDFPAQNDVDKAIAVPRATVADCYTQIIADLDFAEANLPVTRPAQLMVTRATAAAAIALETRVYQHMGDWASVSTQAAKLVADPTAALPTSPPGTGGYHLNSDPYAPFADNVGSGESILSVEWSANDQGSVNGGLGSAFLPNAYGGRGLIGVSPNLFNQKFWTAVDSRRSSFIVQDIGFTNKYYIAKYVDPITNTDYTPLIRYSEVLLNYAEALARTSPLDANAIHLLNAVRGRAGNTAVTAGDFATATTMTPSDSLVQAILNERRIEFIGEGKRWPDIHRLSMDTKFSPVPGGGIPTKLAFADYTPASYMAASGLMITGTAAAQLPYSDHRFLYPVSNVEIANNPNIAQNPGY